MDNIGQFNPAAAPESISKKSIEEDFFAGGDPSENAQDGKTSHPLQGSPSQSIPQQSQPSPKQESNIFAALGGQSPSAKINLLDESVESDFVRLLLRTGDKKLIESFCRCRTEFLSSMQTTAYKLSRNGN